LFSKDKAPTTTHPRSANLTANLEKIGAGHLAGALSAMEAELVQVASCPEQPTGSLRAPPINAAATGSSAQPRALEAKVGSLDSSDPFSSQLQHCPREREGMRTNMQSAQSLQELQDTLQKEIHVQLSSKYECIESIAMDSIKLVEQAYSNVDSLAAKVKALQESDRDRVTEVGSLHTAVEATQDELRLVTDRIEVRLDEMRAMQASIALDIPNTGTQMNQSDIRKRQVDGVEYPVAHLEPQEAMQHRPLPARTARQALDLLHEASRRRREKSR